MVAKVNKIGGKGENESCFFWDNYYKIKEDEAKKYFV
jgi:hypothetical protein